MPADRAGGGLMPGIGEYIDRQPGWFIFVMGIIFTSIVGYIDFLTGNYSLLIFYIFPIALVSWFTGLRRGILVAMVSESARINADYAAFSNKRLLYWNSVEDAVFLMVVAFLIVLLRKALNSRQGA
jgi:hypothetical protein